MIELFDISMEDLVSKNLGETTTKDDYTSRRLLMKLNSTAKDNSIVFVPMKAAAGYLNGYADPEFLDELNTFTLPMIAPGNYRAFEIVGDSMLPTPSGSVVIAEREESFDNIKPTNAYILLSKNEGIVYKRISKVNETKELSLISDNPVYHPYKVKYTDVLEMWKAVYVLNKADEMINLSKGIRD
jgi:Peptidase S24-like